MKAIWTREEAEFHGEFVRFDKIWSYPKPVQVPHPPILMGGDGPTTFDRVIEYCDGWMPIAGRLRGPVGERVAALRRRAGEAGRDVGSLSITIWGAKPERGAIEEMERAGVGRAVFNLPCADRETVLPHLDAYAALVRQGGG
ncbi:MAG TPA: LLM class flavin-dependent oxidoreductase, partial [Candidatus Methylomirabilis sp.]